jgi:hypothetical protein
VTSTASARSSWPTGTSRPNLGYPQTTAAMNPFSALIVDLYGADTGSQTRTAIGVATLHLNLPVVISAEVEIAPPEA